ncbi:MAG: GAF domain-containing sensor histidine kinase [bacterium]|nr:GAF domain-containing sensor histidine kinase [bacterium]
MDSILSVIALAVIAAHVLVWIFAFVRGSGDRDRVNWLLATIFCSILTCGVYLVASDVAITGKPVRGISVFLMLVGLLACFGTLVIRDISNPDNRQRLVRSWLLACGVWLLVLALAYLATPEPMLGQPEWLLRLFRQPDLTGLVAVLGLVITGVCLFGFGYSRFYVAELPEVANRALFWVLTSALLILSVVLIGSGTRFLTMLGMVALLTANVGASYGCLSYRVFDIRMAVLLSLRTLGFIAIAAAMIFTALYLALTTNLNPGTSEGLIAIGAIALLIAALYVPLRQLIDLTVRLLNSQSAVDPSQVAREYSEKVSEAVELEELVLVATTTLNRLMKVRRSALIVLNSTFKVKDSVELLVMQPGGAQDKLTGFLSVYSPVYTRLAAERQPISQFEIEFSPDYRSMNAEDKLLFRRLQMSAYAPIISGNTLIAVLAAGPMLNDKAYYPRDLALLATLAQQTGVVLRNARLLDDMQHLNKSMQSLNRNLKAANEQLNRLDSVKTDFVTIASHELRTPLAQLRGYTDIIDALNDQGMLDQEQTTGLVGNLRKATERMEELISAMLDVSQIDVNAMDLRFTDTPPESVLRMAIEPLTDAIKQRKLTLSARGLRGLPNIQADLPRLVQAFRNIIVNAIKFTPDGGRIDIVASLQGASNGNEVDQVLVEISDTGVGIDRKNLELVFKKFFRTYDPSLHSTGTYKFLGAGPGLGLTIAKGVIEGHGGRIWVESPGHNMDTFPGTTFFILLPVSTPENAKRSMTFEPEPTSSERGTDPKPPIERDQLIGTRQ